MAVEPFRFVHTANLPLDEPLIGLGPVDPDSRRLAEDATLIAWNNVVEACVSHGAEFLLITGPLTPQHVTLRAYRALAAGCASLAEYGIPVYWDGLEQDEERSRQCSPLTAIDNLSRLCGSPADPVPVVREGRVIATLVRVDANSCPELPPADQSRPDSPGVCRIGVLRPASAGSDVEPLPAGARGAELALSARRAGLNYLAVRGGWSPVSHACEGSLIHHPGAPQGLCAEEAGPLGCSIIEVGNNAAPAARPVATAPVRWEQFRVGVDPCATRAQLVEQMQLILLDRQPHACERLWCVSWLLVGSGGLCNELEADSDWHNALAAEIEAGLPSAASRVHRLTLRGRSSASNDPLTQEFLAQLEALGTEGLAAIVRDLAPPGGSRPATRAARLPAPVDDRFVIEAARRLGTEWLAAVGARED